MFHTCNSKAYIFTIYVDLLSSFLFKLSSMTICLLLFASTSKFCSWGEVLLELVTKSSLCIIFCKECKLCSRWWLAWVFIFSQHNDWKDMFCIMHTNLKVPGWSLVWNALLGLQSSAHEHSWFFKHLRYSLLSKTIVILWHVHLYVKWAHKK